MQFTILSHAGLLAEHNGVRLVCDPWLIGSCYWRSWWNFPEPDPALVENLAPQFIYLTHLHWDHFHGPSLKKLFSPKTTILVPKVPTRRMLQDLKWLGFSHVIEIPHGGRHRLGPDFELCSYQFGLTVDSAAVIRGGGYTLFNCNDAKFFGLPLKQVLNDFPKIDFIFRSHSSASPVPLCVENHAKLLTAENGGYDQAEQFARCAIFTGARYAVPFASNHCFLHAETRQFNATATTPEVARRRYASLAAETGAPTECVVMPPGSRWSDTGGFEIRPFDFGNRASYVEELLQRKAPQLADNAGHEARVRADRDAFEAYFVRFLRAIPWAVRRWLLRPLVFRVREEAGTLLWLVDVSRCRITPIEHAPAGCVVFEVHAAVLNDCARQRMFSVWTASKRIRIHLPAATALSQANLWFALLDLYEVDMLPVWRNLSARAFAVRVRRWREPAELLAILLRRMVKRERFSVSRVYPLPRVR